MPHLPLTTIACIPLYCFCGDRKWRFDRVHCTWDLNPVVLSAAFAHALDHPAGNLPRVFCQAEGAWKNDGPPQWAWREKLVGKMLMEIWNVDQAGVMSQRGIGR